MVRLGNRDREAAVSLLNALEILVRRSPTRQQVGSQDNRYANDPGVLSFATHPNGAHEPVPRVGRSDRESMRRSTRCEDDLSNILKKLIICWADASDPKPWFPPPPGRLLCECPIRHHLVKKLGFPRAIYFGRLAGYADWTGGHSDPGSATAPERRVMALCGAALWSDEYKTQAPARIQQILTLLKAGGAEVVLDGLAEIVAGGDVRMLSALDEQMVFLADFFRLGPHRPGAGTTPNSIRTVLLGKEIEASVRNRCLSLYLARALLSPQRVPPITSVFRDALTQSWAFADSVFGHKATFDSLGDEAVAHRLDRVLFGLNLLYRLEATPFGQAPYNE